MKVVVIGTGYVGLVQGACLAHLGHDVTCVDIVEERIEALNRGEINMYEAELPELVREGREKNRLRFTTNLEEAIRENPAIVFVCVQTPRGADGSCDLSYVERALRDLGKLINPSTLVVIKSTVPPGTSAEMHSWLGDPRIQIASNPEFLSQGTSVRDFLEPDRIVLGVESTAAATSLKKVHEGIDAPVLVMSVDGACLSKYGANSMLASRLSFINEIARIADAIGADIKKVEQAIGLDPRIGHRYLCSSAGFGGGCLPKDTLALHHTGLQLGTNPRMFQAIIDTNDFQPTWFIQKVERYFSNMSGMRFAVWGLAFNRGTDDVRHSPAIMITNMLLERGAQVIAYDPQAMEKARSMLGDRVVYAPNMLDAVKSADALFVLTEWPEFLRAPWHMIKQWLNAPVIFDGKHFLPHNDLRQQGFDVHGIGL